LRPWFYSTLTKAALLQQSTPCPSDAERRRVLRIAAAGGEAKAEPGEYDGETSMYEDAVH